MAVLRRPIISLVTDRRRVCGTDDESLVRLVAEAARAGVDVIHVRERDLDDRHLLPLVRTIVDAVRGTGAAVVVNERVDVAIAAGADGVHLRADSCAAGRVRAIAPAGFLIGRSVHSAAEAVAPAALGVDYLILGTVYPTQSKPDAGVLAGISGLQAACAVADVPVLAIGGITADNVGNVAAAGAGGIAAIGLFSDVPPDGGRQRYVTFQRLVGDIRRAFATRAPRG